MRKITFQFKGSRESVYFLDKLIRAICFQNTKIKSEIINHYKKIYVVGTYNEIEVSKSIIFDLQNIAVNNTHAHEIALLKRFSDNPLIPISVSVSALTSSKIPSALVYVCDSIPAASRIEHLKTTKQPLAILPFIFDANRIGLSLGIASCQNLIALNRISEGSVKGNDLLVAVAGVLVNMAKAAATKKEERYLTSATWTHTIDNYTPDQIMAIAETIASRNVETIDEGLEVLQSNQFKYIYGDIFGRIRWALESPNKSFDSSPYSSIIAILSEQMNLFDLYPFIKQPLRILYTPLTIGSRLLLDTLFEHKLRSSDSIAPSYQFHVGLLNIMIQELLEQTIRYKLSRYGSPVLLLTGGGQVNNLLSLKMTKKFGPDKLVSLPNWWSSG